MKIRKAIFILSGVSFFALNCSQKPAIFIEPEQGLTSINQYTESDMNFSECIGRGSLNSQGQYKARLNFTFSAAKDSSHMTFSDLLGRRVLEIKSKAGTIQVKDILKNRTLIGSEIIDSYPGFLWMNANTLMAILWGEEPLLPDTISDDMQWAGELKFEYEKTDFGQRIKSVSYISENDLDIVTIIFRSREFREE